MAGLGANVPTAGWVGTAGQQQICVVSKDTEMRYVGQDS